MLGGGVQANIVTDDGNNQPHRYASPFPFLFIPSFSPIDTSMHFFSKFSDLHDLGFELMNLESGPTVMA
jgi:hypothetical protein